MFLKNMFTDFPQVVSDKDVYERTIDKVEGSSGIKIWLKGIWVKFKDKSQDEVVELIFEGVKTYGPQLIGVIFRLWNEHAKTLSG